MAAHFPRLSLEALRVSPTSRDEIAVTDGVATKTFIWDCTHGATHKGVQRGQLVNAALALAPHLQTRTRDRATEQAALIRLAEMGHNFTPTVSLENSGSLLLEVEGSAHLFGGTTGILAKAKDTFGREGFMPAVALAPTPVSALWLAQANLEMAVTSRDELRSVLGRLPVQSIIWPKGALDAFSRLGITHLTDVLRLPRDGLAKRFGKEFVQTLDRALGKLPDPRSSWQAPRRCKFTRELPGEFTQVDHMRPYVDDLIDDLSRELQSHDAAVNRLKLVFRHWRQDPTTVMVGSAIPYRQSDRWRELVHGRLANLVVAAPVHEIQLLSGRFMPYAALNLDLLGNRNEVRDSLQRLVDLLRSRLGRKAVFGMAMTADARPEQAWRSVEPGESAEDERELVTRPIQLLPAPVQLNCSEGRPRYRGASVNLMDGPERIESGWWAKEAWIRDYYQGVTTRGERLWLFREGKLWFLHGLYS
jgi:protein ImuB